jgi:hypothetical protein
MLGMITLGKGFIDLFPTHLHEHPQNLLYFRTEFRRSAPKKEMTPYMEVTSVTLSETINSIFCVPYIYFINFVRTAYTKVH